MLSFIAKAVLLWVTAFHFAAAIPTISVKGAKFFADGQQFFLQGVAYQGTPEDPLIDIAQCTADANLMKTLDTNSIRVYHVNPWVDHTACMKVFADAGIYIWLDLDTFNTTITQDAPKWTSEQFVAFTEVMDAFQHFDNLGGFWIGNEVINSAAGSGAAPFVKAAVADMKAYIVAKEYRSIPIGYSAADIAELRPSLQNYLACGDSYEESIDFFGLNSYEWCGSATYATSGYTALQEMSEGYSVPIFFSETGCNVGGDRTFGDQAAIFGPDMIDTWSGSIIYEWVQEANDYGLVTYPGGALAGEPIPIEPDFSNLASEWKKLSPSGVKESDYSPSLSAPACPSPTAGWLVNGDVQLPRLGDDVISAAAAGEKPTSYPSVSLTRSFNAASTTAGSASGKAAASATATASGSATGTGSTAAETSSSAAFKIVPGLLSVAAAVILVL
ncbi:1,3-beta-glucanosyltransferase [Phlyctema vagabunda]|uniref:1,3-beta-glucanosyltransferase n=1 Tax=Phlyctema vagabunda TaxID=108571 RepID=A0ABR4PY15_9HELO